MQSLPDLRCKAGGMASLVDLAASHDRPDHAGHFVGHGYTRHASWFARKQREKALVGRIGFVPGSADQRGGANHQELPQVSVAHLGDAARSVLTAARVLRGCEPEPSGELTTRTELLWISDRRRQSRCTDRANAGDGR